MSNAASVSLQQPSPILLNALVQSFLQGIICVQAIHYWQTGYDTDSVRLRWYIGLVTVLSVLETALEDYKVWWVVIGRKLWERNWLNWSEYFLNGLIVSLCTGFLVRRCWKVTGKKSWVFGTLGGFCLVLFLVNLYMSIAIQRNTRRGIDGTLTKAEMRPIIIAYIFWTYGSFGLDLVLTSILTTYFWLSRTGETASNSALWRITTITWESALLPTISMLTAISLFHRNMHGSLNQLELFFFLTTAKLYVVGLLRTLNVRTQLRERLNSHDLGRTSLGNWQWDQAIAPTATESSHTDSTLPCSITTGRKFASTMSATSTSPRQRNGIPYISPTSQASFAPYSCPQEALFSSPQMLAHEQGLGMESIGPLEYCKGEGNCP